MDRRRRTRRGTGLVYVAHLQHCSRGAWPVSGFVRSHKGFRVQLLAQMGGAPPGSTDSPWCCFLLLLLLVVVFALLAVNRNAAWPVIVALVLIGLSCNILWDEVASYESSDGWTEANKQAARREIVQLLLLPLAVGRCGVRAVLGRRRAPTGVTPGARARGFESATGRARLMAAPARLGRRQWRSLRKESNRSWYRSASQVLSRTERSGARPVNWDVRP